jgi:AcrR family transcriptional regulator
MSIPTKSLLSRHAELTRTIIMDAAIDLLEKGSAQELSVRSVARQAAISERTVFRYFAAREDLLDAVIKEVGARMRLPPDPTTVAELLAFPRAIYDRFEETSALTRATLESELYLRIVKSGVDTRGEAIRAIIDSAAPDRPETERRLTAIDIKHHVVASTWRYYRVFFGLSQEDAVACARKAIEFALQGLGIKLPSMHDPI